MSLKIKFVFVIIIIAQIITINFLLSGLINKEVNIFNFPNNLYPETGFTKELSNEKLALNPYLGFVYDYGDKNNKKLGVNQFGFLGPAPILKKSKDKIIIGIFGGSVANLLYRYEKDYIIQKIKSNPTFANKQIILLPISVAGYKQPQQLMSLNYIYMLGGQFDIVIDIDGFNEVALPYTENIPSGTSSFFPRLWNFYSRDRLNTAVEQQISSIQQYQENQKTIDHFFSLPIMNKLDFIHNLSYNLLQNKINSETQNLSLLLNNEGKTYQYLGPESLYYNQKQINNNIINTWKNSSIQMYLLSKANNSFYLQFLQPNQYLENSKTLSSEEKNYAWAENQPYREPVELFYPHLILEGQNLKKMDVPFFDLTQIFKNIKNTIYADNCCHYNAEGNRIIADYIIKAIIDNYHLKN